MTTSLDPSPREIEDPLRYSEYRVLRAQVFNIHCLNPVDYHSFDDKPYQNLQRHQKQLVARLEANTHRVLPPKTTTEYIAKIHAGMRQLDHIDKVTISIEEDLELDEMRMLMESLSIDASRTAPLHMLLQFIYQTFDEEKTQLLCSSLEQPGFRYVKEFELTQCRFTNESWRQLCNTLAKRECTIDTITLDRAPRLENFGLNSLAIVCSSKETRLTLFMFDANTLLFYRLAEFIVRPEVSMPQLRLLNWDTPIQATQKEEDMANQCLMNAIKRSNVKVLMIPYYQFGSDKTWEDLRRLSMKLSSKWFNNATVLLSALCVPRLSKGAFKFLPREVIRDLFTLYLRE